ncbi:MAG TPA: D-alanine--D-alanine ligase [Hyphomicrobiaceae bacterium]|nr:D-alanine--D-alanine ligase [Hyphomicrobiaceae bacterium]
MIRKRRKLRVVMLADEKLLPTGRLEDFGEKERELRKTEYHVRDAIEALGHDLIAVGVLDDLASIRGAIDAHKPHVVFNLVEEFNGVGFFDQHVVSYLELRGQAYTGCNPRGLTLARDKAVTKKILAYHGLPVPRFEVFPRSRKIRRPDWLEFPLFVKSLTEEGSAGISSASIVHNDAKLADRIEFIHSSTKSPAIAEEFIEGREMYVGVMGNDSTRVFPAWEFSMTKKDPGRPLIASDRAKWDPAFQREVGLRTGPADIPKSWATKLAAQSREIYRLLGLSGYARLDYRVTESGRAYLLEANPNPQIAEDEDFAASARHAGLSYPDLIGMLLRYGMSYRPTRMVL